MTEKRVQLSTIVKSQVPDYVRTDFPLITEFLKEYYKGQEYQSGPIDLISNIDRYLKIDSFTNRVYSIDLGKSIGTTDTIIEVSDTQGFPDSYGLLKIDNEIITYTGKTPTTFTGCVRGFSGICDLSKNNSPDEVLFESTRAEVHSKGAQVLNLSVLFLAEFLNKTKKEIALGFDDRDFYSQLNQNTFLKQVRSFYASKGTEDSFKILFKALYGVNVELVNPADLLFRPSDAQYDKVESLVVEPTVNSSEFDNIQNITLFQDFPSKSYAPITYSERVQGKDSKVYYRLDIDAGYNKDITFDGAIYGDFKVTPKTKLVNPVSIGATYLDVESTVGFANTGNISFNYSDGTSGSLYYGSRTINQFRDIDYIYKEIKEEENITDKDTFAYATINGKKVECNISSIIADVKYPAKSLYNIKDVVSRVKTLGYEGEGFKFNEWVYNDKKIFTIDSTTAIDLTDKIYRVNLNNIHYIFKGDNVQFVDNANNTVDAVVESVINEKSINVRSVSTLDLTKIYTLKRTILKGTSASFPLVRDYHSNVQNVYTNDGQNLLVASSSIPSESIGIENIDLEIDGTFSGTEVTFSTDHNLKTGDKVYYYPETIEEKVIDENFNYTTRLVEGSKLFNEGIYYITKVDSKTVKFSLSKENIFSKKFVEFSSITVSNNKIRLYDFYEQKLEDQRLLKEIPVPSESSAEKIKTLPGTTGMLLNGVEILNYKSKNNIYYGEVKSVDVIFSDEQFDIINPPNLVIEDSQGKNANGYLGVTGSLNNVKLVNRGFDYEGTPTIKIVGGNGQGASVLVNMKQTEHVSTFNSRGISLTSDSIGFSTYHKFRDYEEVVYQTNGQRAIAGLTTNSSYFVKSTDLQNIKLFNSRSDAVSGINTINLTAYGIGVHSLKAILSKRQIDSINVVEPGEGYSNRKTTCLNTGINTSTNTITSINHGYSNGDIIHYKGVASGTDTQLTGLSLNTDYIATVLDKDNFTLSISGIGNTVNIFADRKEYVNITNAGVGTHIFNHPPIQVILTGKTNVGSEFVAELQPKFLGTIDNVHISNGGVGYGVTNIQDFERVPRVTYSIGKNTQVKAIVNNGAVTEAIPLNRGESFTSAPDVIVEGDGTGAVLTATIKNDGTIDEIFVLEGGRGYNQNNTTISLVASESLSRSKFQPHLQSWKINLFEDSIGKLKNDDGILTRSFFENYGIQYCHLFAPRYLRNILIPSDSEGQKKYGSSDLPFNRVEIDSPNHSPIIGWAYDGNPIYGPYGYSSKSGGVAVRMKSGYSDESLLRTNRPPKYPSGYFVEDFTYYRVDDDTVLDENNGRYCVTPEFPNGTYAYFTTISGTSEDSGPFRSYRRPVFPYLIGDNYFSVPSKFNKDRKSNQNDFDLNSSEYKRNTSVYNFFDKDVRYPYITLPNDLKQKVTVKTVTDGKVDSVKILNSGDFYKVNDRLVFDQEGSGGNGVAAKVSFVKGKEISKIECDTTETEIEIYPTDKKGQFVGIASTAHGYFDKELITLTNFSTVKSKFQGSYEVTVQPTTFNLVGLGSTTYALDTVANTGIVTYAYTTKLSFDRVRENDVFQVNQEKFKVLNVDKLSGRLRILREFYGSSSSIHTVGTAATLMQRQFFFNSDYDNSFKFRSNKEYYFDPSESVGLSDSYVNPGSGTTVFFSSPGAGATSVYIKPKSLYLKDHGLKTGDVVKYEVNDPLAVALKYEDSTTTVGVGSFFTRGQNYYVAKIDKDFIGIATVQVGLGSTGVFSGVALTTRNIGLLDFTNAGTNEYHSFTTQYPKITADAIKNRVLVSTATTHGLSSDHRIVFDVVPNRQKTVIVKYDDYNRNIIFNPKSFEPLGVNTESGVVTIVDHGFSTGDKLIHTSEWTNTAFDNNSAYYAVKIDSDKFKLASTLYNATLDQPVTVVGVATTAGTLGIVNPPIDSEGFNQIIFDLSDESLRYEYSLVDYPAFDLDFYIGETLEKPWLKNIDDTEFKVLKTGTVGTDGIVKLIIDSNTPKNLFYNLNAKYTQGVPLADTKKDVYLDKSIKGAGSITISNSGYSGSHKVKVATATSFTYNLVEAPESSSYTSSSAKMSYVTDCTHTDGPISEIEILNTGDNYKVLPGFTTITTADGTNSIIEVVSSDIGKINKVEITDYGYDFPYDQTIRPLFYYPQSLKITPFTSLDSVGISSFGRGYLGKQELVVIDGIFNTIVEDIELEYNSSSPQVKILQNTYGMSDVLPKIYPVNSGGGVPVDNSQGSIGMVYDPLTKTVAAQIKTEYSTGDYYPFVVGEKLMVEGSNPGIGSEKGFNSSEHNYKLYTITEVDPNFGGAAGIVTFSMADQLEATDTVTAYDKINSAARLLPERDFPVFDIKLKKNKFIPDEIITSGNKTAVVEDWDEEFSILKINSIDEFSTNDSISGRTSKSIATVGENIFPFKEYGRYGSTIQQNKGWKQIAGFLNNDLQRTPDNDYYQNFSYSLKSTVPLQTWNDPISSMNHISGYKKFANYQLESYERGLRVDTNPTKGSTYLNLIKDIVETVDMNCVNDFDLVRENFIDVGDLVSTEIYFESRLISSFDQAVFNRVLSIDDISDQFSHRPRSEEYVDIDTFDLDKRRFLRYYTLVRDRRFTSERQVSIFDVIHDGTYGYSNEYAFLQTVGDIGTFDFAISEGQGFIRFYPVDDKIAYNDFNVSYVAYKIEDSFVGIGTSTFGDIAVIQTSSSKLNTVGTGVTVVSIGSSFNSVSVMFSINPDNGSQNEEFNFTQMNFVHDGVDIATSGEITNLSTDLGSIDSSVGYGTFWPYLANNNLVVEFIPNAGIGTTAVINTIQIGIAQTATSGIATYNMNHARIQAESTTIASSASPGITTVNKYRYIDNSEEFHASKYWVHVADKTNNEHEFVELVAVDTINAVGVTSEAFLTEYGNVRTSSGLGTFGAGIDSTGFELHLHFTPNPNIDTEVNVFAHHLKSETSDVVETELDFGNGLITDDRDDYIGTFNDVKTDFDLEHGGQDIFQYWFDGGNVGIVSTTSDTIRLPNHFFVSGERLSYYRNDINDESSAIGVAQTFFVGVGLTTLLPNGGDNVYAVKIDDNYIGLSTSAENAQSVTPSLIDITNVGSGTSHRFITTRQNARVLITLDNMIQSPIVSTAITTTLSADALSTTDIVDFVGVTSFFGGDFFQVNDEIMKVTGVGANNDPNKVRVRRARLGTQFANHTAGDLVTKISGNYNIIGNKLSFAEPPYGPDPVADPSDPNSLDWEGIAKGSSFHGRSYMRGPISTGLSETYANNHVFKDVADRFNGIERNFPIKTTEGESITNIADDNAIVLINSVFQLPGITVEEDYNLQEAAGDTQLVFNGSAQSIGYDVGISSFPAAGIIQSIGSTEGFGYQPLVAAAGTATVSTAGTVTNISVGYTGSGYRCKDNYEILVSTSSTISAGSTNIYLTNENSVFGVLETVFDGNNAYIGIGTFRKLDSTKVAYLGADVGAGITHIQVPTSAAPVNDVPAGTRVSIGVTLPFGIVNVSAATSNISPGAVAGLTYDVLDADYIPTTGLLSITLPANHALNSGDYITINDNSLRFTCASDNNTSTKSYPRPNLDTRASRRPLRIEEIRGQDAIVFVGFSTFVYFNVSGAVYDHNTGDLELTIGSHNFVAGRGISLETNSLTFTCAQDGNATQHSYPRATDPAANTTLDISSVTSTTITVNVGTNPATVASGAHTFVSATANAVRAGGQYTHTFVGSDAGAVVSVATTSVQHIGFATVITGTGNISTSVNITNPGFNLNVGVNTLTIVPQIIFDDPEPYANMPLVYSNDQVLTGLGTQGKIDIQVGNGSSVVSYNITNNGYAYGESDILTVPVGGRTGIPTTSNFREFQITVDKTFDDTFNGWSLGELEILDNVDSYIDGKRKLFPLFRGGERLSIIAAKGSKIQTDQLLLVFLNNILQVPGDSYFFFGGNRIRFSEAPRVGDFLRIVFYKGNGEGNDVIETDVIQTVKEGDTLQITSDDLIYKEDKRTISDIVSTDTVETLPYFGPGNTDDVNFTRPVTWCRQTEDKIIDGQSVSKARTFHEPNILPAAYLLKPVGIGSTVLNLSTVRPLFNQRNEFDTTQGRLSQNRIKIHQQEVKVSAAATATVSMAGTVTGFTITNGGSGYLSAPNVSIASTTGVGIGTTTTAKARATITNGVVTGITVTGGGVGYSTVTAPKVLISPPSQGTTQTIKVFFPGGYRGDSGSIVGFATTSISNETYALFDLFIPDQDNIFSQSKYVGTGITVSAIEQGDVFTIFNSNLGAATTSITSYDGNGNVLGISTSFVDGVYEVVERRDHPIVIGNEQDAVIRVRAKVDNPPLGYDFDTNFNGVTGMTTGTYLGSYSWGKIILESGVSVASTAYNMSGFGGISTSTLVVRDKSLAFVRYDETL